MKTYVKPTCQIIRLTSKNHLMSASDNRFNRNYVNINYDEMDETDGSDAAARETLIWDF